MKQDSPEEIAKIVTFGFLFAVIILGACLITNGMKAMNGDGYGPGGDNIYDSPDYPEYPEDQSQFHGRQPGTTAPDTSNSAPIPVDTGG